MARDLGYALVVAGGLGEHEQVAGDAQLQAAVAGGHGQPLALEKALLGIEGVAGHRGIVDAQVVHHGSFHAVVAGVASRLEGLLQRCHGLVVVAREEQGRALVHQGIGHEPRVVLLPGHGQQSAGQLAQLLVVALVACHLALVQQLLCALVLLCAGLCREQAGKYCECCECHVAQRVQEQEFVFCRFYGHAAVGHVMSCCKYNKNGAIQPCCHNCFFRPVPQATWCSVAGKKLIHMRQIDGNGLKKGVDIGCFCLNL